MHIYAETARILKTVKEKRGAVKTLVFSSKFHNKRKLYALVFETLKFSKVLDHLLHKAKLHKKLTNFDEKEYLLQVLTYEYFVGKGLDDSGAIAKQIHKHESALQRAHDVLLAEANASSLSELLPAQDQIISLPRYVRVNSLKTTLEKVVKQFNKEGWKHVDTTKKTFKEDVEQLGTREFLQDPHLHDLLVFPAGTELHKHIMCRQGEIILQDKASCFPAHVLNPSDGGEVIDCCAAPGNKTSHVASLMHNSGKIFAFDKDKQRVKTMERLLTVAGVTNTEVMCQDFLSVDPLDEKYARVEYVVVDPSCSGSGIVGRLNHLVDDEKTTENRLKSLSNFQVTVLKHALSFPRVKRVVYSTCSIHQQENEAVVEEVVKQVASKFKLAAVFPDWSNRGVKGHEHAQKCLRMSPELNLTNGFFVACFNSIANSETDEHFNMDVDGCGSDMKGLTRKEKRKIKKREKKRKLREENAVGDHTPKQFHTKADETCTNGSFHATETPFILRVDNSSFRGDNYSAVSESEVESSDKDSKRQTPNAKVSMLRKRKIDFTVQRNRSCCVVECLNNENEEQIINGKIAVKRRLMTEKSCQKADKSETVHVQALTGAERRKSNKRNKKLRKQRKL